MPRFAILEHDWPHRHWDLLLQCGEVLRAWRLDTIPIAGTTANAEQNFDHRLMYLDYEGPLTGNRGSVTRWDRGEMQFLTNERDRVVVYLHGEKLRGKLSLVQLNGTSWELTFTE